MGNVAKTLFVIQQQKWRDTIFVLFAARNCGVPDGTQKQELQARG
jgi:hypothetical protein